MKRLRFASACLLSLVASAASADFIEPGTREDLFPQMNRPGVAFIPEVQQTFLSGRRVFFGF